MEKIVIDEKALISKAAYFRAALKVRSQNIQPLMLSGFFQLSSDDIRGIATATFSRLISGQNIGVVEKINATFRESRKLPKWSVVNKLGVEDAADFFIKSDVQLIVDSLYKVDPNTVNRILCDYVVCSVRHHTITSRSAMPAQVADDIIKLGMKCIHGLPVDIEELRLNKLSHG